MRLTNVRNTDVRTSIIEVSKLKQAIWQRLCNKFLLSQRRRRQGRAIVPVCTRELSWYVANDSTTFHHTDSVSVMIIAILSLKSELLSQYRMPNALIDVMSSNDTLDSILFHHDLGTSNSGTQ